MKRVIKKFRDMPVALTGLALGISGITGSLGIFLGNIPIYLGLLLAGFLLLVLFIKNVFHFDQLMEEIKNPTLGSFVPTFDMVLMVISGFIVDFAPLLGKFLWWIGVVLQFVFCGMFFYHRFKNFSIHHMIPSWFVPPCGIVVACLSGKHMGVPVFTQILFYIGFVCFIIILPIMLYRLIFIQAIEDNRLPIFAIMGAPPSLCLAGYLNVFPDPNPMMINFLFPLVLFMTGLVYLSFFRILKIPFNPSYASFTFPLAVGTTAILKYSAYLMPIDPENAIFWKNFGEAFTIFATIIISIISYKMVRYIMKYIVYENVDTKN